MQGAFFLMTIVADTRNPNRQDRVDATIDTGRTGKCSTLIFLPKNRVQKKGPVGVVVHLHGSGWTVCVWFLTREVPAADSSNYAEVDRSLNIWRRSAWHMSWTLSW